MIKILIAGDYAPSTRVENMIEEENYSEIFDDILQYTSQSDYSVVNLEAPVVNSICAKPIQKLGPNICCSVKALNAIKYAGFDMLTLANNHFYDYGEIGVSDTLKACKSLNLEYVGGGECYESAALTLYKELKDLKFAFINCCENEFSIATKSTGGSNPINPVQQYYAIQEAKKRSDYVILIVHGGPERYEYPTPRMKELYRFFIDAGADVVINHHQHRYSGFEIYHEKPIFYGLGNFCFDIESKSKTRWNTGYMVMLKFDKRLISYDCIPYVQGWQMPGVKILNESDKVEFDLDVLKINEVIADDSQLQLKYQDFVNNMSDMYLISLEPYSSRLLKSARYKHIIPSTLSKERAINILNYISCESHLDRMRIILSEICK